MTMKLPRSVIINKGQRPVKFNQNNNVSPERAEFMFFSILMQPLWDRTVIGYVNFSP